MSAAPPPPVVELEGVGRTYTLGEGTITALADATLAVRPGELVVVLGPSGSGKSTLLNLIGALDTPTSGRIVVAGQDITRATRHELFAFRRHAVGFIFQSFNLFPQLTALENVQFGIDVSGRDDDRALVEDRPIPRSVTWASMRAAELSSGDDEPVPLRRAVRGIDAPVLLIVSNARDELELNDAYSAEIGGDAQLWHVPDAGHTGALDAHPRAYRQRLGAFLDGALGRSHR